ncbi:MAG: hypothetical protein NT011_12030 [Kiritimatiellaeota bacterium]|nr:hypothetical protein [Kiritimatiellota bacterium]
MNNPEIEKILSRFKLKDSPAALRTRVLTTSRAAWNETPPAQSIWAWSTWRWPAYYAAAAALLLLSNGIVTSLDQRWTAELIAEKAPALDDTPTAIEQLYAELGRDPKVVRRLRTLAMRSEPKGDINEFLRQKNQLLQATELL